MTIKLKQSTASQEVPLGYFLDSTDGNTEETALTIANTDIKLWKMGATTLANKNSGGATHISNGIYYATLDATDTDTLGALIIFVHVAGALAVRLECEVLAANVYDSLIAGTDQLQVDTVQVSGAAQTAGDIATLIGNINSGSSAINVAAGSYVLTTGTQSAGTFSSTQQLDGTRHQHTDTAGALELYYEFDVGASGVPSTAILDGYLNGSNDSLGVFAYNWTAGAWQQIGTLNGQTGSTNISATYALVAGMVGTGADRGKVRIRFFAASGLSAATLAVDRLLVGYAVVRQTSGYANGSVWINTAGSNTNTSNYVDGTVDNPVSTLAAAKTIGDALSIKTFSVVNGSSITLSASLVDYALIGYDWTLALGGQNIGGSYFENIQDLSGIGTSTGGNEPTFRDCILNNVTLPGSRLEDCVLAGTLTCGAAETYIMRNCSSGSPAIGAAVEIDMGSAIGATKVNLRDYRGAITLKNLKAGDLFAIDGIGQITIDPTCTGGTLIVRGIMRVVDNVSGGFASVGTYTKLLGTVDTDLATLATSSALSTLSGYVDTEVAAIKSVTDKLDGMLENTSDGWIWTLAALQLAPAGGSGLDAAGVRAAIGLASANLDAQLDALPTAAENAAAVMGSTIEGAFDLTESARLWNAALAGKVSTTSGTSVTFRDLDDTKDRIAATVDADGNRTAITRDVT